MNGFLLDSSWMVACLCAWHEHHDEALQVVRKRLQGSQRLYLAAPALVETYSVLTRLPAPHRMSAADAWMLLRENFRAKGRTVSLDSKEYWQAIEEAQSAGIVGGKTYDFLIAYCAMKCRARAILTLNPLDFRQIVSPELQVVSTE